MIQGLKKIKAHIRSLCPHCKKEGLKVRAEYGQWDGDRACYKHAGLIAKPKPDSGHYSEADYQTWMRL